MHLKNLFATRRPAPARSTLLSPDSTAADGRREVLSIAVRETLRAHRIPQNWLTTEMQTVVTRQRERGMTLRLVVREWQPQLLDYVVALQRAIRARVIRLDPSSPSWFTGIAWKFDLIDESECPTLPAPLAGRARAELLRSDAPTRHAGDFTPTQPMVRPDTAAA